MKKIMTRVLVCTLLALTLLLPCLYAGAVESDDPIILTVNGRKIDTIEKYGVSVSVDGDVVSFPLSAIIDSYGLEVTQNDDNTSITCKSETDTVTFTADSTLILRNGNNVFSQTPATLKNGQMVISGEALTLAFDLMVNYNAEKNLATVIKTDPKREADLAEKQQLAENGNKNKGSKADEILTVISAMNKGFIATLKLFAITLIGALPLGLIIALCSMSKFLPLRYFTRLLVWIIRGTPLMLQLLIIFYIPGMLLTGGNFWPRGEEGRFMAASVAFIINYAFYFSEIYRGGIENVPKGQVEAGQVLGMTKSQIFFNVTLLQMIKRIFPPMSNEIITLVKDTSIARIISMQEVIWAGYAFLKSSHGYSGLLWPLFFPGV